MTTITESVRSLLAGKAQAEKAPKGTPRSIPSPKKPPGDKGQPKPPVKGGRFGWEV